MPFFRQLKDHFHFNQGERRGLVILFALLLIILVVKAFLPQWFKPKEYNLSAFKKSVEQFEAKRQAFQDSLIALKEEKKNPTKTQYSLNPFPFDPNTLPEKDWIRMGLSSKQVQVIINYRASGGRFHTANDLSKIYSLSEKESSILVPFVKIKASQTNDSSILGPTYNQEFKHLINNNDTSLISSFTSIKKVHSSSYSDSLFPIELNSADTLDLQLLKGIGPSYARRIIKYRQMLGGYVNKSQLLEVYGMDSSRFSGFSDQVYANKDLADKIKVNFTEINGLIKHPYIDYYLGKSILREKSKNGRFLSLKDLQMRLQLPEDLFSKIVLYIEVSEE